MLVATPCCLTQSHVRSDYELFALTIAALVGFHPRRN